MAVLVCENLKYLYSAGTPFETAAIEGVDFTAESGELIGIIGHTGSGKSTLIQHFNGLLEPNSGVVLLDGKNIWAKENKKKIRNVRFAVGLCFQYPEYQIFEESIFKEIAFGPKQMGLSEEEIRARVYESMEFVGLKKAWKINRLLICPAGRNGVWRLLPSLPCARKCLFWMSRAPVWIPAGGK